MPQLTLNGFYALKFDRVASDDRIFSVLNFELAGQVSGEAHAIQQKWGVCGASRLDIELPKLWGPMNKHLLFVMDEMQSQSVRLKLIDLFGGFRRGDRESQPMFIHQGDHFHWLCGRG